ncbi:16S rRNA (guanine(966)-N(2))-methyltransferase RsmD [Nocardia zapadnayensis]|uniref:16S rRNA (guanine(966)-N(2))-methyltransferase RsmD n=1 Tax=Nocardia rhamnosiphila TaxID=426716 RepID=UPI0022481159|nr:16S rRNA (guanine(966)-N(2))-methyltransferase RsmD [Nocardia zapadnayensis]MCX0271969.1 16S rRNA (guanine(966)-N(2))-methyltransferase RsmD [Nocardia zapadnayensis]
MTRIVAGIAGGRRLKVPPAGTRPTSDRVREALFSSIEAWMDLAGARVLDLYAGSGALGLEALSRGAAAALLVESDRRAAGVLRGNIAGLGLGGAQLRIGTVTQVLAHSGAGAFDLVFADPPYELPTVAVEGDLTALAAHGWLAEDALLLVERSARSAEIAWPAGFEGRAARRYGETRIESAVYVGATPADPGEPASV